MEANPGGPDSRLCVEVGMKSAHAKKGETYIYREPRGGTKYHVQKLIPVRYLIAINLAHEKSYHQQHAIVPRLNCLSF